MLEGGDSSTSVWAAWSRDWRVRTPEENEDSPPPCTSGFSNVPSAARRLSIISISDAATSDCMWRRLAAVSPVIFSSGNLTAPALRASCSACRSRAFICCNDKFPAKAASIVWFNSSELNDIHQRPGRGAAASYSVNASGKYNVLSLDSGSK